MELKTGISSLAYTGVQARTPAEWIIMNRAPGPGDYRDYFVGTFCLQLPSKSLWYLASKLNNQGDWIIINAVTDITLTGDVGGAVSPDAVSNNIDILGTANSILVTGTPLSHQLQISLDGSAATNTYVTDSGNASPVAGLLNVLGDKSISTSGAGNTISISVSGTTEHLIQIGDSGGAIDDLPDGIGTDGQILTSKGPGTPPVWEDKPFSLTGFQAYMSVSQTNATGDGTLFLLPFDVTEFNFGNDFDTVNHWYVAPVDGYYQFVHTVYFNQINPLGGYDNSEIFLTRFRPVGALTRSYPHTNINPSPITDNTAGSYEFDICNIDIIELKAGDRVYLRATVGGGAKTVGFTGLFVTQLRTRLAGWLLQEI